MPLEWDTALSVGVEEIDVQHRQILRRQRRLAAAIAAGKAGDVRAELQFLSSYLSQHFVGEERWMEDNGYPGAADHARSHRGCLQEITGVRRDLERSGVIAHGALGAERLGRWLAAHLQDEDRRMGRFRAARENLRRLASGLLAGPSPTPLPGRWPAAGAGAGERATSDEAAPPRSPAPRDR